MPTTDHSPSARHAMPKRVLFTRRRLLLALAGVLAGGVAAFYWVVVPRIAPRALVATGYMARVACACHFIGGRSLESCLTDSEPGMELVRLSKNETARRITASVPLIASSSATHTVGLGCVLDARGGR
jgi:hypothetical protein